MHKARNETLNAAWGYVRDYVWDYVQNYKWDLPSSPPRDQTCLHKYYGRPSRRYYAQGQKRDFVWGMTSHEAMCDQPRGYVWDYVQNYKRDLPSSPHLLYETENVNTSIMAQG